MNRETVILNLLNNYEEFGVTKKMIEQLINEGLKDGLTYNMIYLNLDAELSERYGKEFYCTSSDMARAFGVSNEEMDRIIAEARKELIAAGENPDEYFQTVEVQPVGFMM